MRVTGLLNRLVADGRVVIVSSGAHAYARGKNITFDDLMWNQAYKPWSAYGQSKLANILFAKELANHLPDGQTANALHPGIIETPLWRHLPPETAARMKSNMGFRTIAQGAATQVFVATHPSVAAVSAEYFGDCTVRQPTALAQDEALAARLWNATQDVVDKL